MELCDSNQSLLIADPAALIANLAAFALTRRWQCGP
jgi:hypothetical protein